MARHCSVCGYPLGAAEACGACGTPSSRGLVLADAVERAFSAPTADDYPELRGAFVAWRNRDFPRLVGQCLQALSIPAPQVTALSYGPGWAFQVHDVPVFVSVHEARDELYIDCPLVLLNRQHHVAMLRSALEINLRLAGASRLCLREDRLVLRFADRMSYVSPPKFIESLRDVAGEALGLTGLLHATFSCQVVGTATARKVQALGLDWRLCGTPHPVSVLTDGLLG